MTPEATFRGQSTEEVHEFLVMATVAQVVGIHPNTVRRYQRAGLLEISQGPGDVPLMSPDDVDQLRRIQRLSRELGLNLAAIDVILHMRRQILALREELAALRDR